MQVARAGRRAGQHAAIQEPSSNSVVPDATSTPQASRACGQARTSAATNFVEIICVSFQPPKLCTTLAIAFPPTAPTRLPTCRQDLCSRRGSFSTKAHRHSSGHSRKPVQVCLAAPACLSSNKRSQRRTTAASQLLRLRQSRGLGSAWIWGQGMQPSSRTLLECPGGSRSSCRRSSSKCAALTHHQPWHGMHSRQWVLAQLFFLHSSL
jgi:hypothetical protein